jgi:hypothetical protein
MFQPKKLLAYLKVLMKVTGWALALVPQPWLYLCRR